MKEMVEYFDEARTELMRLKVVAESLDFTCYDIDEPGELGGVGLGVGFVIPLGTGDEMEFVAVSLSSANPKMACITAGVLRDVQHDRAAILEECNRATWDSPTMAALLHANDVGWDVLLQERLPVYALVELPRLFGALVSSAPKFVEKLRASFAAKEIAGTTYQWNQGDVKRLIGRSVA